MHVRDVEPRFELKVSNSVKSHKTLLCAVLCLCQWV